MMNARWGLALALPVVLVSHAGPAAVQAAVSTRIDPSVRSAGMGGASTALVWSDDLNGWANPALLGYTSGLRYRWSNTELVSPFTFRADRFSYGWGGIGLAMESHTIDYGPYFGSRAESVRPLGVGISLARTLETVASLRGGSGPRFIRYADVAAGFSRKHVRLQSLPAPYPPEADADANDFGLLLRGSPLPRDDRGRPAVDVTYGFAALNYDDASFPALGGSDRIARQYRHGLAARIAFPRTPGAGTGPERGFGGWIAAGMDPLVSVVIAADLSRLEGIGIFTPSKRHDDHLGLEVAMLNVLSLRWGHVGVRGLEGHSFGVGLGLSLADFAGARYDFARRPRGSWPDAFDGHAVAVWFDPVAFVHRQP